MDALHIARAVYSPRQLGGQLGRGRLMPIIGMRHHNNHAYFSCAVSPFERSGEKVLISVLDGIGDDAPISLYLAQGSQVTLIQRNPEWFDSLGAFYRMISSTQGGWTILSSEGRYMGSAAWGDGERLTNPYYQRLRELFHFAAKGTVETEPGLDPSRQHEPHSDRAARYRPNCPRLSAGDGPLRGCRGVGEYVAERLLETPVQALETLRRSKAMDGVLLREAQGGSWLAWHTEDKPPKDERPAPAPLAEGMAGRGRAGLTCQRSNSVTKNASRPSCGRSGAAWSLALSQPSQTHSAIWSPKLHLCLAKS
jgi:hypothetical protein